MSYLSSTKEEDNTQIGAFGIGLKSFMSLDRSAIFICIKDGWEYKYMAYMGTEFMEYDLLYEKETTEENGVTCEISIKNWGEYNSFKRKAISKLSYYDTIILEIDNEIHTNKIIRSENWQFSENSNHNSLHLCLKDVLYTIDYSKLGINNIYIPIALRFNLDSGITPTPSRESLLYTTDTTNIIKNKIKEVADYFVNKYNENYKEEKELMDVWGSITDSAKYVKIADESFCIDSLAHFSKIPLKELKIKGVSLNTPKFYYDKRYDFDEEYDCIVDYAGNKHTNKTWKIKHIRGKCNITDKSVKHILINKIPTGRLKQYLLEKYTGSIRFIKKVRTRALGKSKFPLGDSCYRNKLNLTMYPKSEWRQRILEYQFVENHFKSLIIDETTIEESLEYITWSENEKQIVKENRALNTHSSTTSNYVRINKKEGDVVLQMLVKKEKGDGGKFLKKAVKITDLNKLHKSTKALHIYFTEDEKERAKKFYDLFGTKFSICVVSPRELKVVQENKNKQFMTEKEFTESNAFCKIMSSLKYDAAIEEFDNIYRNNSIEIIENALIPFKEQRNTLREYTRKNGKNINDELLNELKEIAKAKNLYDRSLDDVYNKFTSNIKKYDFISCLSRPRSWEHGEVEKYQRLINSMLLLKSKYNNYEEFDITLTPKVTKVETEELVEELV